MGVSGSLARPAPARGALAEAAVFVAGAVTLGLFEWKALFTGATTLRHDHVYWGLPIYSFFAESVGQGLLPLWNPFTHGGEPAYLPLFQLRLLDPLALLVALAGRLVGADLITLYAWDRFVRGVVIAAGSYLLLRLWARHPLTRLSLIPILLFSSIEWSHIRQMAFAEQFLVAPFVLLFFFRIIYLHDNRWRNWLAGALLFGLNFQTYFFTGTMILLVVLLAGLFLFRRRLLVGTWRRRGLVPRLAVAVGVVLVMLAPSLVLLSETDRFVFPPRVVDYAYKDKAPNQGPPQFEPRREIQWTRPLLLPYRLQFYVGTFSAPGDFAQLLAPFGNEYARPAGRPWGKPSEAFMYVGMLPLAVALVGLVVGRHSLKRVWILALVVLGLLALGPQAFLHAALYWVFPPLWFVRNTHTLVLFFVLALLYFYVLGCNRFLAVRGAFIFPVAQASGPFARAIRISGLARGLAVSVFTLAVGVGVVTMSLLRFPLTFYVLPFLISVVALGWWLRRDLGRSGLYWSVLAGFAGGVVTLAVLARDRTSVLFICVFLALPLLAWVSWSSPVRELSRAILALAFTVCGALVGDRIRLMVLGWPGALGPRPGLVLAITGGGLAAALLWLIARDVLGRPPRWLSREGLLGVLAAVLTLDLLAYTAYVNALVQGPRPDRFVPVATAAQSRSFPETRALTPARPPYSAYAQTIRYLDLMTRRPAAFSPFFTPPQPPLPDGASTALQIEALLHGERASTFLMTRGYYELLISGARGDVLAEILAIGQPLVQFKPEWIWLSATEARGLLADSKRAPELQALLRRSVLLERPVAGSTERAGGAEPAGAGPDWYWAVKGYDYNSLDLNVHAPARGVLYWADGYDPYWRARVDGTEVPVYRANLAFKAIFVPDGRHTVRFEYRPTPIVVSSLLFVALGFVGAAVAVWALATPPRLPRFGGPARDGLSLTAAKPAP